MDLTVEELIERSAAALAKGEWLQSIAYSNLAAAQLVGAPVVQQCGQLREWMENQPQFACLLPSKHAGEHMDKDGDSWT